MQEELIKLKVKKEVFFGYYAHIIKYVFIESCLRLETSIFESLINKNKYFQELEKYRVLGSLKQQFDWSTERSAKNISMKQSKCMLCHK